MFRTSNFDKLLDKATSNLLMEPDWASIILICDLIRQNDVQPKYALASLKKKLTSPNPHTALYSLLVLESMVKNCGPALHEELTTRPFCDVLHELSKTPHEHVKNKLVELIQVWSYAFRKNPKHGALKDLMNTMKTEGLKFPVLRESDAMFSTDTAPEWVDGDVCHRCRVTFTLIIRRHHCRACGQVFCNQCTAKTTTLPKFGIEKEVRVCDGCFEQANKPAPKTNSATKEEPDLPPEYLSSSLAQQNQAPPRKSEEELREEEELQLALALSQSEAEAKEKQKHKTSSITAFKAPEPRPVEKSPSPVEEPDNPELARYLNRTYWESVNQNDGSLDASQRVSSPSAPATAPVQPNIDLKQHIKLQQKLEAKENGESDTDLEEFISTLKSQVEIFINRMKINSSRGRSIANDTSVQSLFMNITAMHSRLLRYIQQHDDSRLHYERLQDKLTQVKDARAALDALRDEHREKLRREAEEAERQRQLQMAQKLDIMRKKKQEYLQYQRQLALQRVQEQEREMQMRQEQQKQQYLMGLHGYMLNSPVHTGQYIQTPGTTGPVQYQYPPQGISVASQIPTSQGQMGQPSGIPRGHIPQPGQMGPGPGFQPAINQSGGQQSQGQHYSQQGILPPHLQQRLPQPGQGMSQPGQGMPQPGQGMHQPGQGMAQQGPGLPQGQGVGQPGQGIPQQRQGLPQGQGMGQPVQSMSQGPGLPQQGQGIPQPGQGMPQLGQGLQQQGQGLPQTSHGLPQQVMQYGNQPGAPPASPQVKQELKQNGEAATAELISFD